MSQVFQASTASAIFTRFSVVWENLRNRWGFLDTLPRIGKNCEQAKNSTFCEVHGFLRSKCHQ